MISLSALTKLGTALFGIVSKIFGNGGGTKADELHAQTELVEAEAFKSGHVAPRYVFQYVMCGVAGLFALVIAVDVCWPDLLPGAPAARLADVLEQCGTFFVTIFGE